MLDGMVERMEAELGYPAKVIATGGIARFITPMCKTQILYDKDLIVKGLAALYRENRR
jgi:type III pantothenate kinase